MDSFAQDFCFGSANLILQAGRRCYANKFTIFGDFEYHAKHINLEPLLTELGGKMHISRLGEFKARFTQFEDLKEHSQDM